MNEFKGARRRFGVWCYLLIGLGVMILLAVVPGGPFGRSGWPCDGVFGAFTWTAWVASGAMATAFFFIGRSARGRSKNLAKRGAITCVLLAGLSFGAAAAAGSGMVEHAPLVALAVSLVAFWMILAARPA